MPPTIITASKLRRFWQFGGVVVVIYVLIYSLLSLCGQYRPNYEGGLGRMVEYSVWAPFGFYDPDHSPPDSVAEKRGMIIGTWRASMVLPFFPLWLIDTSYVHKSK
jgi:hypothetical protein